MRSHLLGSTLSLSTRRFLPSSRLGSSRCYWKRGNESGLTEQPFVSPLKKPLPLKFWKPDVALPKKGSMAITPSASSSFAASFDAAPDTPATPFDPLRTPSTQITTLPSGLRVVSEDTPGTASTVGVYIRAGSMYESPQSSGLSNLLQRLCFKSTKTRSASDLVQTLEEMGMGAYAAASRDAITYSLDITRDQLPSALDILSDTVLNAQYTQEEVEEQKAIMPTLLEGMETESLLLDRLHEVAYGRGGLGLSEVGHPDTVMGLTRQDVVDFVGAHYIAPRMVVVGAGCEHSPLVDLVQSSFSNVRHESTRPIVEPENNYAGGQLVDVYTQEQVMDMQRRGEPLNSHVVLGWKCPGIQSTDIYAVFVLDKLMGGGTSFSSGGPGKGMYTRLYTNVLNRNYWAESAMSFLSIHDDGGLFGVSASCPSSHIAVLTEIVCQELMSVARNIGDEEFNRAKNRLRSNTCMNLEMRGVVFEDIGRAILSTGHRITGKDCCEHIDRVTKEDVLRVAKNIMTSLPSYVVQTEAKAPVTSYDDIVNYFGTLRVNPDSG